MKKSMLIMGMVLAGASGLAIADSLYINAEGKVGFGTNDPKAPQHIVTSTGNAAEMIRFDNNGGSYITFVNNTTNKTWWFANEHAAGGRFMINHSDLAGIGPTMTVTPQGDLWVAGSITAAVPEGIPDYVFKEDYQLMGMNELKDFIAKNSHLPDVPSEKELKDAGSMDVSKFQMTLLKKIEELTLYTIQQQEQIDELRSNLAK